MNRSLTLTLACSVLATTISLQAAESNPMKTTTASSSAIKLPPFSDITFPNGARIMLMEKRDVPLIAFTALIRGGAVADPAGQEGVAALTAELLQKGAGKRTAAQFAEAVDSVGGALAVSSGAEFISVRGEFMNRNETLMVALLSDMLRRPAFPAEEVEKVRERAIESIAAAKDSDLRAVVPTYFKAFLYGAHPYGKPPGGSEATLPGITRDHVLEFYKNHFGGDRLILAVVGDFNAKAMEAKLRTALADWAKGPAAAPAPASLAPLTGRRVLLVDKPGATQTYFWIGNAGTSRSDPQIPAIDLANTVFGGRFTSLLNNELRVKTGLSYGAGSVLTREIQPGIWAISTYTKTETTDKTVDLALDILKKFRAEGTSDEMLESARSYVLGQFPPTIETGNQIASRLAEIALYGLPKDEVTRYGTAIGSATQEEIKRAISRVYADPANLTFVFIGDADAIREVVKKYGPVTEMKITDKTFAPPARPAAGSS